MKKKMLKKLLALTSVAALAVSSLAGCSGGSTAPAESTEASTESTAETTDTAAETTDTAVVAETTSAGTGNATAAVILSVMAVAGAAAVVSKRK